MLKDEILNVFNFQQRCRLHIAVNTDVKQWNTIYTETWRTVPEHIVADVFHSKKSSSAPLIHEIKHHKNDSFQVTIQRLGVTTKGKYKRTQAVCAKRLNV